MSRFKLLWAFMIPLAGVLIGGCGATASTTNSTADSFPLSLSTAKGKVTISHRPARIVSLSPTATEDLYSVGAGQQVVAVDSYSTHPAEAPRTSLSGLTPNIEAVAGYHPDLVLVADDTNNLVSQLGKLHIPVLVEPPAADLGGVYAEISQIGQATGHSAQATTADSGIKQQVQTILRSMPARRAQPADPAHSDVMLRRSSLALAVTAVKRAFSSIPPAKGDTLQAVLSDLEANYSGISERLVDHGKLHRFVNIYVNDEDVRFSGGLDTEVSDGDSVTILPAVAGG